MYKTTNIVNNKIYIGQKKSNVFLGNKYLGSGKCLKQDIYKYGVDAFTVELLYECNFRKELDDLEMQTIKLYRSKYGDKCYNKTSRAGTWNMPKDFEPWNKGKTMTEEYKQKVSIRTKLAMQRPEVREKILARNDKYLYGNHHHKQGSKLTDEQRANVARGTKEAMTKIQWTYVHNDVKTLRIKQENLQKYLDLGWTKGRR